MASPSDNLTHIYQFFNEQGTERLNGLDKSHLDGLTATEIEDVWEYLRANFTTSTEGINFLFIINKTRAASLFKDALTSPIKVPSFPENKKN
jgi:hypothetical protein